jgi:signal transduction histidine kinase
MRLRTRFRISSAASVGAVLLAAAALAWTLRETRKDDADVELARSLVQEQYERGILRDSYLLLRSPRARAQWEASTTNLSKLVASAAARFDGAAAQDLVAEMDGLLARTGAVFREILRLDDAEVEGAPARPLAEELRTRAIVTLRTIADDLYSRSVQLQALASARQDATQRQTLILVVALLVLLVVITIFNSQMATVVLTRRVLRLRDGTEEVAAGNLDHRIGVEGNDELAEVGNAFDRMTEQLQKNYAELAVSNQELEAFSYAVSHDLRAPLRSVSGFSQAALEDYGPLLDARGRQYLEMASESAKEMGQLIDDLLGLSRVGRLEMARGPVDLSELARSVVEDLRRAEPERRVEFEIAPNLLVEGDSMLLRLVMENLLRNAWKFTAHHPTARIRVGRERSRGRDAVFVADDGAGFDMTYGEKLFQPFQRLHRTVEFPGTGIGLATVSRIVRRHGGEVWAEGEVEKGATIRFTLPAKEDPHADQGHLARGGQPEGRAPDGASLREEPDSERAPRGA